ncbi:MAG: calcium/sodium antiporter [Alphaproteobacteria bacterium]
MGELVAQIPGLWGLITSVVLLVAGLALLVGFGDYLVTGAVKLAARLRIPVFFIGLTIVAFGTSAPELFVAIKAALEGSDGVVYGNVVGSNICNILLVLGLPALLFTISAEEENLTVGTLLMLASTVVFVVMALPDKRITFLEAGILLALLAAFLAYSATRAGDGGQDDEVEDLASADMPFGLAETVPMMVLVILGAAAGLALGAELTVSQAILLSSRIPGVSQEVVGLTVIALGTSLPELSCTIAAARRKEFSVGFGNILGSNIFNIHAIAGIATLFTANGLIFPPMDSVGHTLEADLVILIAASSLASFYIVGKNPNIDRLSGLLLFSCYLIYLFYLVAPVL